MIACATIAMNSSAPVGFLIADQRSCQVFDPVAGKWTPTTTLLAPAAAAALVIGKDTTGKARFFPWPSVIGSSGVGYWLLWADLGEIVPGDQIVAFPYGYDANGHPYPLMGWPTVPLRLSDSGRRGSDGWTMLPAPGVTASAPATTPPVPPIPALPATT